ncbi:MAG: hypothetical protein H0X51_02845 [Parachlamydiaceae bacterium]|nr:hypothetical protein [Parachlamydiaceae bacterium]
MYAPVATKTAKKSSLNTLQATFNKHRRKIDQLREKLNSVKGECEQALSLYHSTFKPVKKKTANLIITFLLKITSLTKPSKALGKQDRETLNSLLEEDLDLAFFLISKNEPYDEFKTLYKEIHGKDFGEVLDEEMSSLKEMLQKEAGFSDAEMSQFDPNDNPQEIFKKFASMFNSRLNEHEQPLPKQKSKKEMLKVQKARDLETLQNKGLSNIYKRLVKELHPDLEQDLEKRLEKEKVMKQLTVAYEKNDLLLLLALEAEWLGNVDLHAETLSEESLKAYNSLLKDQIDDLKDEIERTFFNPRYLEMHSYIGDHIDTPIKGINDALSKCDTFYGEFSKKLKQISGKDPLVFLKKALTARREHESMMSRLSDLRLWELDDEDFDEDDIDFPF